MGHEAPHDPPSGPSEPQLLQSKLTVLSELANRTCFMPRLGATGGRRKVQVRLSTASDRPQHACRSGYRTSGNGARTNRSRHRAPRAPPESAACLSRHEDGRGPGTAAREPEETSPRAA